MPRVNKEKSVHWVRVVDGRLAAKGFGPIPVGADEVADDETAEATHPELKASRARHAGPGKPLAEIDAAAVIPIEVTRLAKAHEAELVLFEGVTDLDRLPTLAPAVVRGDDLREIALEIWHNHSRAMVSEDTRVAGKANIRATR